MIPRFESPAALVAQIEQTQTERRNPRPRLVRAPRAAKPEATGAAAPEAAKPRAPRARRPAKVETDVARVILPRSKPHQQSPAPAPGFLLPACRPESVLQAATSRASAQNRSSEISSARAVGLDPLALAISFASISGPKPFKLDRNILRRWLKAMAVIRFSTAPSARKARLRQPRQMHHRRMDLGRRREGSGGRCITIFASQRHCTSRASLP